MNKTTNFFGTTITRLIIGDNPFTGHSYIEEKVPGTEMRDYYTSRKIYETLFKIEESGINCMLPLADPFNIRMIREYQRDGGKMKFIFQAYMPMNQEVSIRQMAEVEPIGVYHQGTTTDYCFEKNQVDAIKANIKLYKTMGIPVGVGTHRPDVIEACEREDWGADFYLTCLHNTRKDREGEQSGFLTGKTKAKFKFWAEDRPIMLEAVRKLSKPCIAFKIFSGGQIFLNTDGKTGKTEEEIEEAIRKVFIEVYSSIKPIDLAAIGIFQKYKDELSQNVRIFNQVMEEL